MALLTNILVAKRLTLDQIAFYYLYVTLAYAGNAGLFVGLGVVLQRICASLASQDTLHKKFLVRFVAASLALGLLFVALFSGIYLLAQGATKAVWAGASWCAALSGATYLSQIGKDLLALSKRIQSAALFGLIEQTLRFVFVLLAIWFIRPNALDVTAAAATASAVAGIAACWTLLILSGNSASSKSNLTIKDAIHTVAPIGFSGALNWLQLQSYRPALLLFGIRPEVIGIASLLTTLGMTGANPVFVVTAQTYIPRFYSGDESAFRRCMVAIVRSALFLMVCALPAACAFLFISGRQALFSYISLVPLGVLIEAGNSVVGASMHRRNATGKSMWVLVVAGLLGVLVVGVSWTLPVGSSHFPYLIATGMAVSQVVVIGAIFAMGGSRKPGK